MQELLVCGSLCCTILQGKEEHREFRHPHVELFEELPASDEPACCQGVIVEMQDRLVGSERRRHIVERLRQVGVGERRRTRHGQVQEDEIDRLSGQDIECLLSTGSDTPVHQWHDLSIEAPEERIPNEQNRRLLAVPEETLCDLTGVCCVDLDGYLLEFCKGCIDALV